VQAKVKPKPQAFPADSMCLYMGGNRKVMDGPQGSGLLKCNNLL
jgi:hypothetical protein